MTPPPRLEQEQRRQALEQRLQNLLSHGIRLRDAAHILDADDFLTKKSAGKKGSDVYSFDVAGFVSRELGKLNPVDLPDDIQTSDKVIIPPDDLETRIVPGETDFEKAQTFPRTQYLRELLTDMNLPHSVVTGLVDPRMVRSQSYVIFLIPDIRKLVFVNDEEGNRTFIIHDIDPKRTAVHYTRMSKEELKAERPGARVSDVIWPGDAQEWKKKMRHELETNPESYPPITPRKKGESKNGNNDTERTPDEWLHLSGVSNLLGSTRGYIAKISEELLAENPDKRPDWIEERPNKYSNTGVSDFYSPEFIQLIDERINKIEIAPDDWLPVNVIAGSFSRSFDVVEDALEEILKENPDKASIWKKEYRTKKTRKSTDHYHPDLIEKAVEQLTLTVRPDGWLSRQELQQLHDKDEKRVKKILNAVLESKAGRRDAWIKPHLVDEQAHKAVPHYHPTAVYLVGLALSGERVLEPRFTAAAPFALKHDINPQTLNTYIDRALEQDPERVDQWVQWGQNANTRQIGFFYDQDFLENIKKIIDNIKEAPEGWLHKSKIAKNLHVARKKVRSSAKKILENNPEKKDEWIKDYALPGTRTIAEHYHPDFIALIKKEVVGVEEEIEVADENWMTVYEFAKKLGISRVPAKNKLESALTDHPEKVDAWKQKRRNPKTNRKLMYYHKDLTDLVADAIHEKRKSKN